MYDKINKIQMKIEMNKLFRRQIIAIINFKLLFG